MPKTPDRTVLNGLVEERATAAWTATYEHSWQRDRETWKAVLAALDAARGGARPAQPRDSPPRWLAGVARRQLADTARRSTWRGTFDEVRRLERLGLVSLDVDDTYVLAMVSGLADRTGTLRADPELVERALWRVFEVEGGGEVSLANVDRFYAKVTWQETFVALVTDGTLPRERVLRSCLAALARDFLRYRAAWYAATYDALAPSVEEQAAHQDDLRTLLRSAVGPTVAMAVRRLRAIGTAGLLDDEATVAAVEPALLAPAKATALAALRLLDECVRRDGSTRAAAAALAGRALEHPAADVQRAAAKLVDALGGTVDTGALSPSVAADLGVPVAPTATPATSVTPVRRGAALVRSRDEVVERVAALLEDASDPYDVEAVLAALAALDEPEALRPLAKRAATVVARGPREGAVPNWLRGELARLVLVAVGQPALPFAVAEGTEFLAARLGEVAGVLARRRAPFAMLATPDDGPWVRPETLVRRLTDTPAHHDLVAAVLRLAPEGRDAASAPEGPAAEVVAYALGRPAARGGWRRRRSPDAWWVAAARARAPLAPDERLVKARLTGAGRAGPIAAMVEIAEERGSYREGQRHVSYTWWKWAVVVAGGGPAPADQPTAVPARVTYSLLGGRAYEDWVGWLALTWPHDAEHFLVRAFTSVAVATHPGVQHDAPRVLHALAAHPGRLGPLAAATLAAGLMAAGTEHRVVATDAVVSLAPRLPAAQLATELAYLAPVATATRTARSLADVAASGLAPYAVAVLDRMLPRLPYDLAGLHALLATLREESLRTGARPSEPLRAWLAAFPGGGAAGRTAKALLER